MRAVAVISLWRTVVLPLPLQTTSGQGTGNARSAVRTCSPARLSASVARLRNQRVEAGAATATATATRIGTTVTELWSSLALSWQAAMHDTTYTARHSVVCSCPPRLSCPKAAHPCAAVCWGSAGFQPQTRLMPVVIVDTDARLAVTKQPEDRSRTLCACRNTKLLQFNELKQLWAKPALNPRPSRPHVRGEQARTK